MEKSSNVTFSDIMSTHDRQEEELKKQIEKIAESVKEKGIYTNVISYELSH